MSKLVSIAFVDDMHAPFPGDDAPTPAPQRYFIDSLPLTGEIYLIPADRRMEWDEFDIRCEETHELLPVPAWARAVEQLSWIEFERPEEVFK